MNKELEAKSINGRLIDINCFPIEIINNNDLGKKLQEFFIEKERGKYFTLRIVPIEFALEGSGWRPRMEIPSHIVYARHNPEIINYGSSIAPSIEVINEREECKPISLKEIR